MCLPIIDSDLQGVDPIRMSNEPAEGEPLVYAALRVLYEPNAARKAVLTHRTADLWRAGKLSLQPNDDLELPPVPKRPARDDTVLLQPVRPPRALGSCRSVASARDHLHQ